MHQDAAGRNPVILRYGELCGRHTAVMHVKQRTAEYAYIGHCIHVEFRN